MNTPRALLLVGLLLGLVRGADAASLDKEVIRRVIRVHIHEVRRCYEGGLTADPKLNGKVVLRFAIDPSGSVIQSDVVETTLNHQGVETCIAGAVRTWQFPRPAGKGPVVVTYPFVLRPTE